MSVRNWTIIITLGIVVFIGFVAGMTERDNHHRTERECIRAEKYGAASTHPYCE